MFKMQCCLFYQLTYKIICNRIITLRKKRKRVREGNEEERSVHVCVYMCLLTFCGSNIHIIMVSNASIGSICWPSCNISTRIVINSKWSLLDWFPLIKQYIINTIMYRIIIINTRFLCFKLIVKIFHFYITNLLDYW